MTPQAATEEHRRRWISFRALEWYVWRIKNNIQGDELSDWLNAEREYEQWAQWS